MIDRIGFGNLIPFYDAKKEEKHINILVQQEKGTTKEKNTKKRRKKKTRKPALG